jgi:nucleolar protein 56
MIIQSICILDQLDKDLNTMAMRCREWYSWHFPELIKIVSDNYQFCQLALKIGHRSSIKDEESSIEMISNVCDNDESLARQVWEAAKHSMGFDINEGDIENISAFATRVVNLFKYRIHLQEYLSTRMMTVAPNLATLVGEAVGARLISHAGSLTNLAKYPASTVQILGAEKALFRALKTKGNTPKYGLIFHSTFIGRAAAKNKGRISRYLANKCSIASRIDCFAETTTNVFGLKLREQVEERLNFYDTGKSPRKNIDVMTEAVEEVERQEGGEGKKKKKRKQSADDDEQTSTPKKKDKKKKVATPVEDESEEEEKPKKKKKKVATPVEEDDEEEEEKPKKKKKDKKK